MSRTLPHAAAPLRRAGHRIGVAAVRHHGSRRPMTLYRYRLPRSLSWTGAPGRLEVPLDKVTTGVGFSFSQAGWHPHTETLRWLEDGGEHPPQNSPLAQLYEVFRPRTVGEAVFDEMPEALPGVSELPLVRGQLRELWNPYEARTGQLDRPGLYWGPASPGYVAAEVERTLVVYRSLRRTGFQDRVGKNAVSGYLLVRGEDYRFVVHQGHHRLACLAALGFGSVTVHLSPKVPPIIDGDRLDRWVASRRPRYPRRSAELLFERLFESTGTEKARRLGLFPQPRQQVG